MNLKTVTVKAMPRAAKHCGAELGAAPELALSTGHTATLEARERYQRRRTGPLRDILEKLEILVLIPEEVSRYKAGVVAKSTRRFRRHEARVRSFERRLDGRGLLRAGNRTSLWPVAVASVLVGLAVSAPSFARYVPELTRQAFLLGNYGVFLGVPILAVLVTRVLYRRWRTRTVGLRTEKAKERFLDLQEANARLGWKRVPLEGFPHPLPERVALTAVRLMEHRDRVPDLELFVEETTPVEVVELNTRAWTPPPPRSPSYPDPFLIARSGYEEFYVAVWDESDPELGFLDEFWDDRRVDP
ncbi:MAG: hypothetical protein AB7N24_21955 [Dehalococcoidia bacterium]